MPPPCNLPAEPPPRSRADLARSRADYAQLAWSYWHSSRQAEAEAVYWEVLDDDVLCWQALVDRARMFLGLGNWVQALCDLAQVAAMGKADADVCNDLGVAHFETGDDEAACKWFGEAVAKNASHAPAISNRANCLRRQGRLREAESDYTRAIDIDNSNPKAYLNRGMLLKEQGMNSRAHRDLERVTLTPRTPRPPNASPLTPRPLAPSHLPRPVALASGRRSCSTRTTPRSSTSSRRWPRGSRRPASHPTAATRAWVAGRATNQ